MVTETIDRPAVMVMLEAQLLSALERLAKTRQVLTGNTQMMDTIYDVLVGLPLPTGHDKKGDMGASLAPELPYGGYAGKILRLACDCLSLAGEIADSAALAGDQANLLANTLLGPPPQNGTQSMARPDPRVLARS